MEPPPTPVHARTGHTGRPVVVIGLLGTTLDKGTHARRWSRWRPTVSACAQPDLLRYRPNPSERVSAARAAW